MMSQDSGPSSTKDIQGRMKCEKGYANVYRTRLIKAGVIQAAGHGKVDFVVPGLREYLRKHEAHILTGLGEEDL